MNKRTAVELVTAIRRYQDHPNTRHVEAHVVLNEKTSRKPWKTWSVLVMPLGDRYFEVPTRLPLRADPCPCRMRYCASGKVAPGLLEIVRNGGKGSTR